MPYLSSAKSPIHHTPLKTAVLFLIFNRPDTTRQVFEAIRQAKPPRLYVAADGPRNNQQGEKLLCEQERQLAIDIDWKCEVKTLFRDTNLGCKQGVSSAIDWFFNNEDEGIILEDDCLPSQNFFWFCEELLERYRGDMRIWHIGGYVPSNLKGDNYSYNFSRYTHVWGWASWASRWKHYDIELSTYLSNKNILCDYEFFRENYENQSRVNILNKVVSGGIDTWDYQWNFAVRINSGLSIRPKVNLISNIGFGDDATHTIGNNKDVENNNAIYIDFPLLHPDFIMVYKKDDNYFSEKYIDTRLFSRMRRTINAQ